MTNFERIKAMSVEELAAVLANDEEIIIAHCSSEHCEYYSEDDIVCLGQGENKCVEAALHWLNSEVEDDTSSVTAVLTNLGIDASASIRAHRNANSEKLPKRGDVQHLSPQGEGLTGGQKYALLRTFLGRGGSGA